MPSAEMVSVCADSLAGPVLSLARTLPLMKIAGD
jgi:hypothetical protein